MSRRLLARDIPAYIDELERENAELRRRLGVDRPTGRFRYEQKLSVILAADGLDSAYSAAKAIAEALAARSDVEHVAARMLDLKHRPDLDGSLRC